MRLVSGLERIWLAARDVAPPFANQLVLEGQGPLLPAERWRQAIEAVAALQPGCRLRLRGALESCRWVADGALPALREEDGAWDGQGDAGAPFLRRSLDPTSGPVYEVLLLRGEPCRVVFRSLHAASDAIGMLYFARAVCAQLRGQAPQPAVAGPLNDAGLAQQLGVAPEAPLVRNCVAPVRGAASDTGSAMTWSRLSLDRPSRDMIPRLAVALARDTSLSPGESFRIDVPVDLRRHAAQLRSTANLTGLLRLSMGSALACSDPLDHARQQLGQGLEQGLAAAPLLAARWARSLPLFLLRFGGHSLARRSLKEGRYSASAVISNLGRMDLQRYACGDFQPQRAFFVPPGSPGLPAFVTLSGGQGGLEVCVAMPCALADQGRLTGLLTRIRRALKETG